MQFVPLNIYINKSSLSSASTGRLKHKSVLLHLKSFKVFMFTLKAISRDSRDHHTFMMSHKKYWEICVDRHSSRMTHSDPVVKHIGLKMSLFLISGSVSAPPCIVLLFRVTQYLKCDPFCVSVHVTQHLFFLLLPDHQFISSK